MNINKLIVVLFFLNPVCICHKLFAAEVRDTQNPDSENLIKEYRQALDLAVNNFNFRTVIKEHRQSPVLTNRTRRTDRTNRTNQKEGCENLEKLSKKKSFILYELAKIRLNQHCMENPQWENLKIFL